MAKRSDIFQDEALSGLYSNHPHLLIFQKEDWKDYLTLLAHIYDLIEEDNVRIPYEVVRSVVLKFFSLKKIASLEGKISQFFTMAIGDLKVLKDSHDHLGQRYIETTRYGKELLQFVEGLLNQRTRFSGTGAETLLASLNHLLVAREQVTCEQALEHHKQKIKDYQEDIQRIKTKGLEYAELLPIPHSNEALFSQAEEAAIHILSSVEDVKTAIERQRQEIAEGYFESSLSAGRRLNTVIDFYEGLHKSSEYVSYTQAKNLLSYLEGLSSRFPRKNVDHLIHHIQSQELVDKNLVQRSQLRGFSSQFQAADNSIQEKIKSQLRVLQQQVSYALHQDTQGLQKNLQALLAHFFSQKSNALDWLEQHPVQIQIPSEFCHGDVQLFHFQVPPAIESSPFALNELDLEEQKALFEALLAAEEATLQAVLEKIETALMKHGQVSLATYDMSMGLAEYYVLSEIELFAPDISKTFEKNCDLTIQGKFGSFVLLNSPCYLLKKESEGYKWK